MKEYWTDTILDSLVPAGTDVPRGEPVRIYKTDEVDAEFARNRCRFGMHMREINGMRQYVGVLEQRIQELEEALKKAEAWKNWWRQKAIDNRNHKEFILEPPGY